MQVTVHESAAVLGRAAAREAAAAVNEAIADRDAATIVVATGASQFAMYEALAEETSIDWSKVTAFHLDEYAGISESHPASFVRYLKERFVARVGDLRAIHFVDGEAADPHAEARRLSQIIAGHRIDVCLAGIGENGHLAFNDPPADFETKEPYLVVELDEACRRQQMGEGWFEKLDDVPRRAVSMSVSQIMTSRQLILSVPDERKARAVRCAVEGPVTPDCPASIVQRHRSCSLHLDAASASLLEQRPR
jgi:glucosamine-6-phosphate deaminase